MAITGQTELRLRASLRGGFDRKLGFAARRFAVVAGAFAAIVSSSAWAQRWTIEPGISSQLSWTSNAQFGTDAAGGSDTIFTTRPRITVRAEGGRLRLAGAVALNGVAYADGTLPSRVLPEGDVNARLEAVERWFFLEASARAIQTSTDAFGVRPEATSTSNTLTTTIGRFSPYVEGAIGSLTRYSIRSDSTWTNDSSVDQVAASSAASGYFGRHAAFIEHDPKPLGWRIEAERSETRYRDEVTKPLVGDLARLVVDYAITEELSAGLRTGYERNSFVSTDRQNYTSYGGQTLWRPSARTLLTAEGERRFYGSSWRLRFDHRAPQLSFNVGLSRGIESAPQSLFELPATGNVAALIDAMFTTRYPDPAERLKVVQKFIVDQGLPATTLGPTNLRSQRLSLVTASTVSVGFIGSRNSLVISAFGTRTEDLPDAAAVLAPGGAAVNNVQYGSALTFSHRFGLTVSLGATLDWSRIRGLNVVAPALTPETTTQSGARVQLSVQASPKTSATFGGRYRKIESTAAIPGREGSVYVGLDHRF
jgi:uncharacterized protein (PEP-CTERM system associated)